MTGDRPGPCENPRSIAEAAATFREGPSTEQRAEERQLARDPRWLASKKELRTFVEVPLDNQRVLAVASTLGFDDPEGPDPP